MSISARRPSRAPTKVAAARGAPARPRSPRAAAVSDRPGKEPLARAQAQQAVPIAPAAGRNARVALITAGRQVRYVLKQARACGGSNRRIRALGGE